MKVRTILLLGLMFSWSVYAQTGGLKGNVKSKDGGDALVGATISLPKLNQGTNSDSKGNFAIENVKAGSYELVVKFIGYAPFSQEVTIVAGQTTEVSIRLSEEDIFGDEVIISASKRQE